MRLLVFGHNDWWTWEQQGFCTRAAALARALADRDEIDHVFVVDTPGLRSRGARPPDRSREAASPVAAKITAVGLRFPLPLPVSWHAGRRLNEMLCGPGLRRRVGVALPGEGPVVLWVSDPQSVALGLSCAHDLFTFDAIDDWREHWWVDRRAVERGYGLAAAHADLVTAVTGEMLCRLGVGGTGTVIPNAVDAGLWAGTPSSVTLPAEYPRPVVAYVGSLQERLDVGLLDAVARRLPQVSFVLAGAILFATPTMFDEKRATVADIWRLAGRSGRPPANVHYAGRIDHAALPSWLAGCDATMVPHTRDRMTSSMDPLKIYEYLAAGRPLVSTLPPPNARLVPFVRCAQSETDFAAALNDELANDDDRRRAVRVAAARGETWTARAAEIVGLLQDRLARRRMNPESGR